MRIALEAVGPALQDDELRRVTLRRCAITCGQTRGEDRIVGARAAAEG